MMAYIAESSLLTGEGGGEQEREVVPGPPGRPAPLVQQPVEQVDRHQRPGTNHISDFLKQRYYYDGRGAQDLTLCLILLSQLGMGIRDENVLDESRDDRGALLAGKADEQSLSSKVPGEL
jgi:hypothetical protein